MSISEQHLSVLFYTTQFLVRRSVLIEWHWVCYQLAGLLSSFFRRLAKISRPPSHFGIFIANKEEGVSQLSLRIKEKKLSNQMPRCASTRHYYAMPILLCFSDAFLHFMMFILAMFQKLTIVLLESSLWFETTVKQIENS